MKRDNGEFVLIDPFWEGETPYQTHDRLMKGEIDYDYDDNRNDSMIKGGELYKKPKPPVIKKSDDDNKDNVPF
jgi:hypothetical protein